MSSINRRHGFLFHIWKFLADFSVPVGFNPCIPLSTSASVMPILLPSSVESRVRLLVGMIALSIGGTVLTFQHHTMGLVLLVLPRGHITQNQHFYVPYARFLLFLCLVQFLALSDSKQMKTSTKRLEKGPKN